MRGPDDTTWDVDAWWRSSERGSATTARFLRSDPWPDDGVDRTAATPVRQYWLVGGSDVSLCHPDPDLLVREAMERIPMGYKVLLLFERVAVAHADGSVTDWGTDPGDDEPATRPGSGWVPGYDLYPQTPTSQENVAYPGRWPATSAGRAQAIEGASRAAVRVGHDLPVGRIRQWIDWH